jgi:hypothetical protein
MPIGKDFREWGSDSESDPGKPNMPGLVMTVCRLNSLGLLQIYQDNPIS